MSHTHSHTWCSCTDAELAGFLNASSSHMQLGMLELDAMYCTYDQPALLSYFGAVEYIDSLMVTHFNHDLDTSVLATITNVPMIGSLGYRDSENSVLPVPPSVQSVSKLSLFQVSTTINGVPSLQPFALLSSFMVYNELNIRFLDAQSLEGIVLNPYVQSIIIEDSPTLADLSPLLSVRYVQTLRIFSTAITNLDFLANIVEVGEIDIDSCPFLGDVSGFRGTVLRYQDIQEPNQGVQPPVVVGPGF